MDARAYIEAHRDEFLTSLKEWLAIPSISADPERHDDVRRSARWLADHLTETGFPTVEVWETPGLPAVFAEWRAAVDSLAEQTIDEVALPRFELARDAELNEPLQQLGMGVAFDPAPGAADFQPMSPTDLYLEVVVHTTYLKVVEPGTEAAAVTGGAMGLTSADLDRLVFEVYRPFAFTISDSETGTVLSRGAIA